MSTSPIEATVTVESTLAKELGPVLDAIPDTGVLTIPLAQLPVGSQISLTIVIGPPAPLAPAPEPQGPRFIGGGRRSS